MTKYDKELQTGTPEYEEATEPLEEATRQHPENRTVRDEDEERADKGGIGKKPVRED